MRTRWCLGVASAAAVLCATTAAHAFDVLAHDCLNEPDYCKIAPIAFVGVDALPIEWQFDTGWVPSGSPLQVHLWAGVYANTRLSLAGELETSWPFALTLRAPGKGEGGYLGFHYGLDVGAQAKVVISVLGQNFSWTGDIPYVPQIDLQVQAGKVFDAWGWKPGVTLEAQTVPQTLAQVGIGDIIGGSIPGIDGGFELDVALELSVTWINEAIVVSDTQGTQVAGGPLLDPDTTTLADYAGGPNIELDVHPEGTMHYDGVIHLIPAFYVELLGQSWSIPVADIPISFPITSVPWSFDPQRVHVPLPDVAVQVTEIDFGEVAVGDERYGGYPVENAGEADAEMVIGLTDADNFALWDETLSVDAGTTIEGALRFVPQSEGPFEAELYVTSNDPDEPEQVVLLKGVGVPADAGVPPAAAGDDPIAEAGCGCRVPGESRHPSRPWWALAAGATALFLGARRRRRR